MKNRGITLVELTLTMVLSGILLLVMTCQFIAHQAITTRINNEIAISQEEAVIIEHMSRTLRFAFSTGKTGVYKGPLANDPYYPNPAKSLSVTVEGGHIAGIDSNTRIEYGIKDDGTGAGTCNLEYRTDNDPNVNYPTGSPVVIATGLISNVCTIGYDSTIERFRINITAQKGGTVGYRKVYVPTTIRPLPE